MVVVEAGGLDNSWLLRVPAASFIAASAARFNWNFVTEPIPALNGRDMVWLSGKVLGGSSSINAMVYARGHSSEYDAWRQMGCDGWGFSDLLPYFKRSEANVRGEGPWHGGSGPMKIRPAAPRLKICDAFLEAASASGFPVLDDLNCNAVEGFGYYDINVDRGVRMSAPAAYLRPVLDRPNLTVITGAPALRVTIENGRATGAEVLIGGEPTRMEAEREVIISAGAVKSPQLLMLSGIGPAEELSRHAIRVLVESPGVGANLQNHVCYRPRYLCSHPVTARRHVEPLGALKAGIAYALARRGPLAESYGPAGGFFRTDNRLETADAQVVLISALPPNPALNARRMMDLLPKEHGFAFTIYQGSPSSRGEIRLRSGDPLDSPIIRPGYLSHPADMPVLTSAVRIMRRMMRMPVIARFIEREISPGDSVSDDDLEAEIRRNAATAYHQSGTCAMGRHEAAVVDPKLRVRGIDGLRVADTSIVPRIPNAAMHAVALMIGEKAAAMISNR